LEIAIPKEFVKPFIKSINSKSRYNVQLRQKWESKHIVICPRSITNNAPTLGSVLKAIMDVKPGYLSIVSNGLRMKFKVDGSKCNNYEGDEEGDIFWKWIDELRSNEMLEGKVELPILDIGVVYELCNYPVLWKSTGNINPRQKTLGKGWRKTMYPVFNLLNLDCGGATVENNQWFSQTETKGIRSIKYYISPAHTVRNVKHSMVVPDLNYAPRKNQFKTISKIKEFVTVMTDVDNDHSGPCSKNQW
jgi:hypothetical protein